MSTVPSTDDSESTKIPKRRTPRKRAEAALAPIDLIAEFCATYPFPLDDFQRAAIEVLRDGQSVLVAAPTGTGKALEVSTPVLTPFGWKPIAEIRVGDAVIGAHGKPITVLGVFPQGKRPAYRVTFSDRTSVVCDIDHLWTVNTKSRRFEGMPWRVLTLRQILEEGLTDGGGRRHFIPVVKPVEFCQPEVQRDTSLSGMRQETGITQRELAATLGSSQGYIAQRELGNKIVTEEYQQAVVDALNEVGPLPRLDPYLLGLLLGDGCFSTAVPQFTSADDELIDEVKRLLPRGAMLRKSSSRPYDWLISSNPINTRNPVTTELFKLRLLGHRAETNFIPQEYKFASIADRIAMLQGLLDSDGSIDERGLIEYSTVSPILAEDVTFLIRSLGGRTRIKEKPTNGQLSYRLHISMPDSIPPFRLTRKAIRCRSAKKYLPTRAIDTVEAIGEAEMVCISVDAPDGLFVINDFIVTHNTVVAEFAIWRALRDGKRVFYTAPVKALSNQKFRDFRERYGEANVGLMTGDIVENPTAPIVVMTTEIYRNVLLELERDEPTTATEVTSHRRLDPQIANIACIIFDELHYMADPQRGPVWEECIIHSPPHVQFVGLSATVHNASDLVAWISQAHGPTQLVFHPERAIPLEDFYHLRGKLHLVRDSAGKRIEHFPNIGGENKRHSYRQPPKFSDIHDEEDEIPLEAPQPGAVLLTLQKAELLPCLYFLPGRKAVEEAAQRCMSTRLTTRDEQMAIAADVETWLATLADEDRALQQVQDIAGLLPLGLAFHHAGLLPSLKMLVETLFGRGMLRAVFSTDTLALGVNMPARSVVLGSLSKFDGTGMRLMTPNEYQQLTGRAGRRGLDARGAAILLYSPWEPFEACFKELTKALLPVMSAFSMRYNSVLNLWRPNQFERLRRIGAASFLEFQRRKQVEKYSAKKKKKQAKFDRGHESATTQILPEGEEAVALGRSVEHELVAISTVLRSYDYIGTDDTLTLRGRLLRAIFHPAGLILTELMLSGALDDLTSAELAEVVCWFVYDTDKPLWSADVLSDRLKIARRAAKNMSDHVRRTEIRQSLAPSPAINDRFQGVAIGWAQGLSLSGLRGRISLAEGDLLMVLNQTIDLLRQLESAINQILEDTELWDASSELVWIERRELRQRLLQLKASMALSFRLLMRGTVAQSRTLPFRLAGLPVPAVEEIAPPPLNARSQTDQLLDRG